MSVRRKDRLGGFGSEVNNCRITRKIENDECGDHTRYDAGQPTRDSEGSLHAVSAGEAKRGDPHFIKVAGRTIKRRRMEYVPTKSEVGTKDITVDQDTLSILKELGVNGLLNIRTSGDALSPAAPRGSSRNS